jgi:hypothetical protein
MAKVDSFSFGSIVIEGKKYRRDILILPDGTVKQRKGSFWMFGSHNIKKGEIEEFSQAGAEVAVVGTGTSSKAMVAGEAESFAREAKLELAVLPSPDAVQKLNELLDQRQKVAALIHITC